jgi:ATP-dependent helicase/nuclease subunit B
MNAIVKNHRITAQWRTLLGAMEAALQGRGAHASCTVVLLPFAQLMPLARAHWAAWAQERGASGFVPRFETTLNWAANPAAGLGTWQPQGDDLRMDAAQDLLTATELLRRVGMGERASVLATRVLDAALSLAPLAAAVPPPARSTWASERRASLEAMSRSSAVAQSLAQTLALEQVCASVALAWLGSSGFATDVLFDSAVQQATDLLIIVRGLQTEPVSEALAATFGARCVYLDWPGLQEATSSHWQNHMQPTQLHLCTDAQDEAERCAAAVLRHLAAGQRPVAVCATDRALVRRVRALLGRVGARVRDEDDEHGRALQIRDETGWKLSTTRAAAAFMALLRAAPTSGGDDAAIALAKFAPALSQAAVSAWERQLRTQSVALGLDEPLEPPNGSNPSFLEPNRLLAGENNAQAAIKNVANELQNVLADMRNPRRLSDWLLTSAQALQQLGLWQSLQADAAGQHILQALHLDDLLGTDGSLETEGASQWHTWMGNATQRMTLADFTHWATHALESASFTPEPPADPDVMLLPLQQVMGRPIATLVLPGCDATNLPAVPEPSGPWTRAQREVLGLTAREQAQAAQAAAWAIALQTAPTDLLLRQSSEGRAVQASPLLLGLQLAHAQSAALPLQAAQDPREISTQSTTPTATPQPAGDALSLTQLSASAYADLRACPYKFFAQRLMRLRAWDELSQALDKRDFGNWLHSTLRYFHEKNEPLARENTAWSAMLNVAAEHITALQGWSEAEFLPYASMWPRVRDAYVKWLTEHRSKGYLFVVAEASFTREHAGVQLVGKLDRVDRMTSTNSEGGGQALIIDYKTESPQTSSNRVREPLEDTQLAFYAALSQDKHGGNAQAAYLNLSEKETKPYAQPEIEAARDALLDGIDQDLSRIRAGQGLAPLGEGLVCEHCDARGLCRKDWWPA